MTVAVTGAAGHVGGNLVRALLEQGRRVRTLVREDTRALDGLDVELYRGDIFEPESLKKFVEGCDVVYHLAAMISISGDPEGLVKKTNVDGVKNMVNACLEGGIKRLIHFSSIHAMSPK